MATPYSMAERGSDVPVIRISPETWERLKRHATPLVHTPNDIVEMALNALEAQGKRRGVPLHPTKRASQAKKDIERHKSRANPHSVDRFRVLLLQTILGQGGKAYSREIRTAIERALATSLDDEDYELVSNGQPRWWNSICSMRNRLISDGLFRKDSPRGVWELTPEGLATARRANRSIPGHA